MEAPLELPGLFTPPVQPFCDAFRHYFPERAAAYTVWSTATAARINNHGQRIDYTLVAGLPVARNGPSASPGPLSVAAADISPDRDGSDHCPVWVDLAGGPVPVAASAPPGALRHVFSDKQVACGGRAGI